LNSKTNKVHIRNVWRYERQDFSKWLVKQLPIFLSNLGLDADLSKVITEAKITGSKFSADIMAHDTNGSKIIIENQLTSTNYDHLGKLIVYTMLLNCNTVIWITSEVRQEFELTISELNKCISHKNFYLVKVLTTQIPDTVIFDVISGPRLKRYEPFCFQIVPEENTPDKKTFEGYTLEEASNILGISLDILNVKIVEGIIPFNNIDKKVKISKKFVDEQSSIITNSFSVKEASKLLGKSTSAVYKAIANNRIPATASISFEQGRWRIPKDWLLKKTNFSSPLDK
jgi:excisionase family DNA binding protein